MLIDTMICQTACMTGSPRSSARIITPHGWGETEATPEQLKAILKPCPDAMEAVPISAKVGNVKNDGPELIEKIAI